MDATTSRALFHVCSISVFFSSFSISHFLFAFVCLTFSSSVHHSVSILSSNSHFVLFFHLAIIICLAFFLSMTYVIISFSLSLRRLGIGLKESDFCCWWVWYCCKALGEPAPTLELGTMVKIPNIQLNYFSKYYKYPVTRLN